MSTSPSSHSVCRPSPNRPQNSTDRDGAMILATVFGMVLVAGGAMYVVGLRDLFGSESFAITPLAYLRAILLGWALVLFPFATGGHHCLRSAAGMLAVLLVFAAMPRALSPAIDIVATVLGFVALRHIVRKEFALSGRQIILVAGLALVTALFLAGVNLRHNASTPIALETSLLGLLHKDTLFHAAVAQNLLHSSLPSIGADGLTPITYHVFSHRVIAGFSTWLGTEVLHGYALFTAIVAIPVLLTLLLQAAVQFYNPNQIRLGAHAAMFAVLGWLTFGGALMWHSYYISESYTLSLWLLILAMLLLYRLIQSVAGSWHRRGLLLVLAFTVALAALSKVSVGAVLACAVVAGLAVEGRFRPMALLVAVGTGVLPALVVYLAYPVTQGNETDLLKPFAYFRFWKPAIYALLLTLTISFLAWRHFPRDAQTRAMLAALSTGMWAGLVVSYLLNTAAGAQYYFSDPGSWLGLLIIPLLGLVPKWITRKSEYKQLMIVSLFIVLCFGLHDEKLRSLDRVAKIRVALTALPNTRTSSLGERAVQYTSTGRALQAARAKQGRYDAIAVAANHTDFWQAQQVCWATSLVLPALLGKPMLQGIIPQSMGCTITAYYGFSDYNLAIGRAPVDLSPRPLCLAALARKLTRILVISSDAAHLINCRE